MSDPLMCYVAGKFSAPTREGVEANIRKAEALGLAVSDLGVYPVVPHANTSHPLYEKTQPYPFWIKGTRLLQRACQLVIFTDDWHESSGARGEHVDACVRNQPRFFSIGELEQWLIAEGRLKQCKQCWRSALKDFPICGPCLVDFHT